jgi:hypothetical protein
MQGILFGYNLDPITWAYVSALMMIGIYFKFRRFWSVRNLDLVALIAFSPGLLLIYHGLLRAKPELVQSGYVWLFAVSGFFLIRLLLDPVMVRRPLLEPNLSASGLTFTGVCLLVFLMANVITTPKAPRLERELAEAETSASPDPGCPWFHTFAEFSKSKDRLDNPPQVGGLNSDLLMMATRAIVILAHLAVVAGMVWIGYRHFDNIHTGVAAATLYLLTFCTSQLTSQVDHVVPAALLVWAVAAYRRPLFAGWLLGLAAGLIYYPLFLLPLWCGFYWRRGLLRFIVGVSTTLVILTVILAVRADNWNDFLVQLQSMVGWRLPLLAKLKLSGFWHYHDPVYRIPVLAAFVAVCGGLAIWPAQKNLGTLLSCSAAVMLASQFWQTQQGGLHMAWYLPLLILTVFRPNLEDRVALSAVRPAWGPWRRKPA